MVDKHNPNPARRNNPVLGTQIMFGMKPSGTDHWSGQFYNTEDGKTYAGNLILVDATTVTAEGCLIGICMGETWRRRGGPKAATR